MVERIGSAEQRRKGGAVLGGLEVEDDRALVAVERRKIPAQALAPGALTTHWIAVRRFDLDDVGAEIAKQHAAERTR